MDPYEHAREELAKALQQACNSSGHPVHMSEALRSLQEAKKGFGDVACTIAFEIAKRERRNPFGVQPRANANCV